MSKTIKLSNNTFWDSLSIIGSGDKSLFKVQFRSILVSESASKGNTFRGVINDEVPTGYSVLAVISDYTSNADVNFPQINYNHYGNEVRYTITVNYTPTGNKLYLGLRYIYIHNSILYKMN